MIRFRKLKDGSAKLTLSNADKSELARWLREGTRPRAAIYADLFEPWSCNGSLTPIYDYGLTDAPAFARYVEHDENGNVTVPEDAEIWWFSDYAIRDELQELAESGSVIFQLAKGDPNPEPRANASEITNAILSMRVGEKRILTGHKVTAISARIAYYRKTRKANLNFVCKTQKDKSVIIIRLA